MLSEIGGFRFETDVMSYSAAMSACEKGYRWEQALSLFPEVRCYWLELDVISYNAAMSACEKG